MRLIKKYIVLLLFIAAILSCTKEGITPNLQPLSLDKIIRIDLSSNSKVLFADGTSQLAFKVRAFYEVEKTKLDKGKEVKYLDTVAYLYDRLDFKQFPIKCSNGDNVENLVYTTTKNAGETVTFTCTYGNMTSKPLSISVKAKPADNFTKITIPVVFHVVYNALNESYNAGVTTAIMQRSVERLNAIFSAKNASPYSVDTKIEFVLAQTSPSGAPLREHGITRNLTTASKDADFVNYIKENLLWDAGKYLNIWLYPSTAYSFTTSALPKYVLDNNTSVAGLNLTKVKSAADAKVAQLSDMGICLALPKAQAILQGSAYPRFEGILGTFYGLLPTSDKKINPDGDSDYCSDTYVYQLMYYTVEKWMSDKTIKNNNLKFYFDSFNMMDEYSYATAISYEQALRVRKVIENCPLRMMKK